MNITIFLIAIALLFLNIFQFYLSKKGKSLPELLDKVDKKSHEIIQKRSDYNLSSSKIKTYLRQIKQEIGL
ncbi:MAG: hypothetical protein [Bacteriophage sp.]|nr:MAG: hypothetical protein [Bacteriophage sp.]